MSPADGPPDFVGVGAYGWDAEPWLRLLRLHPAIEARKSLNFFGEFCVRAMEDADAERYHALFPRPDGSIAGEWTPRYMYDPWVPPLLQRAAPDAKLLILLGDPVERYRQKVTYKLANLRPGEEVYMADALAHGRYASQLRGLLEHFERERILVLQYEKCRRDPVGEYGRTLRFLGVDDSFVPKRLRDWRGGDDRELHFPTRAETGKRVLVQTLRRKRDPEPVALWPELLEDLHVELDPEVRELEELAPDLDLSLWPSFSPGTRTRAA